MADRVSSAFVSYWLIKSNTQKTSSFSEVTMSRPVLTASMASMMKSNANIISSFGDCSVTVLTVYQLLLSLMRRYSALMAVSVLISTLSNKSEDSLVRLKSLSQACFVTSCGVIHQLRLWGGRTTKEESAINSGLKKLLSFWRNTGMIWSVGLIRSCRMAMNSLQRDSWWLYSQLLITVETLTMQEHWWVSMTL